jgi:hypothetical protein
MVKSIENRKSGVGYSTLEWFSTGTLQLQRLVHEGAGYGSWSKCDTDIPIVDPNDRLAVLDLNDAKHPRMRSDQVMHEKEQKFRTSFIDMVPQRQLPGSSTQNESHGDAESEKQSSEVEQTIIRTKTDRTLVDEIEVSVPREPAR